MVKFRVCPECGASLDPGETCDCIKSTPDEETKEGAGVNGYRFG